MVLAMKLLDFIVRQCTSLCGVCISLERHEHLRTLIDAQYLRRVLCDSPLIEHLRHFALDVLGLCNNTVTLPCLDQEFTELLRSRPSLRALSFIA
jgi:hypothetical protein